MKTILGLLFLLMSGELLFAQTEIVIRGSKKTNLQHTPRAVIDSFEKRYPRADHVSYYQTPLSNAKNGWTMISSNGRLWPNEKTSYYTVSFRIKNFQCYSLFEKNGKLVKHKAEQKKNSMPAPVKQAADNISVTLPGYFVPGKNCYKVFHIDSGNQYYELSASNGTSTKLVYYTPGGQLVKVKE